MAPPEWIPGSSITWESLERHRCAAGGGGTSPPASCKSNPVANRLLGLLLDERVLAEEKKILGLWHTAAALTPV